MLLFYLFFFWFLGTFINVVTFNLKDTKFNLLNEFFFCLDSFSTTFIIFYLVLFFLVYDLVINKILKLNLKAKNNTNYLFIRFFFNVIRNLSISFFFVIIKTTKKYVLQLFSFFKPFKSVFFKKSTLLWRPLFKRWSYFGLWSKKNNRS